MPARLVVIVDNRYGFGADLKMLLSIKETATCEGNNEFKGCDLKKMIENKSANLCK